LLELVVTLAYARPVSASDRVNPPARLTRTSSFEVTAHPVSTARTGLLRWSGYAWGAIGATVAFIGLTCWWLTQDRSIPIYDVGTQMQTVFEYHRMLQAGDLLGPFTFENVYPILGHMVGAVAALIGGLSVAAPVLGENLVFVPLLALGCYQTGRLLFGPLAGMLAVVFVFGSPLIMEMFHVFLLDAPVAAMVALSMWLILASEDFRRVGISGLAGLAVGLGMNVKVQFALFVFGLTAVVFLHGGWRNWRGFATFVAAALLIGTPWYIQHSSELGRMIELSSSGPGTPPGNIPPTFSTDNLLWYFWSILNSQLLLPLFLLAVGGIVWMTVRAVWDHGKHALQLEFLLGGFLAWFVITFPDAHHDIRYGLPIIGYLAVVATGWIGSLPPIARIAAIALLIVGVSANTLGITFGVGGDVKVALTGSLPPTEQYPDRINVYATTGFLVAAPSRDGDVPGLLEALKREGVSTISWSFTQSEAPDFSLEGLRPLAQIAGLTPAITEQPQYAPQATVATLLHEPIAARTAPPCTSLRDRTGVWVVRYEPTARKLAMYCPTRTPRYYAVGTVH
jgi:4-amino-4-deoxy-L-arabinose transferase-like glycosyltransferase